MDKCDSPISFEMDSDGEATADNCISMRTPMPRRGGHNEP